MTVETRVCPRCQQPALFQAFYGPCELCRTELDKTATTAALEKAVQAAEAEDQGFVFDPTHGQWGAYVRDVPV